MTLPLEFDTAAIWRTIVRYTLIATVLFVLSLLIAAMLGKVAAAVQLTLVLLVALFIMRRVRGFPMGAHGVISASDVTTYPVSVWRIALAVPVGRFPLAAFSSISLEHRIASAATPVHPYANVWLVGDGSTPRIELFTGNVDVARTFAEELSALIGLGVVTPHQISLTSRPAPIQD